MYVRAAADGAILYHLAVRGRSAADAVRSAFGGRATRVENPDRSLSGAWDESKVNREPEGAPQGRGGQFAEKGGSGAAGAEPKRLGWVEDQSAELREREEAKKTEREAASGNGADPAGTHALDWGVRRTDGSAIPVVLYPTVPLHRVDKLGVLSRMRAALEGVPAHLADLLPKIVIRRLEANTLGQFTPDRANPRLSLEPYIWASPDNAATQGMRTLYHEAGHAAWFTLGRDKRDFWQARVNEVVEEHGAELTPYAGLYAGNVIPDMIDKGGTPPIERYKRDLERVESLLALVDQESAAADDLRRKQDVLKTNIETLTYIHAEETFADMTSIFHRAPPLEWDLDVYHALRSAYLKVTGFSESAARDSADG